MELLKKFATSSTCKYDLLILIILQLALGLPFLSSIPRIYVDEAWDAALGYNLANEGKLSHPFIIGFGGMDIQFVQNRVVLPLVCATMFKFVDCTIFTSRLCSQLLAIFAVVGLYAAMHRWFGRKQALFITLATIIHPWFFEVARRARPEIYYTAFAIIFLWLLILYFESGSSVIAFLSGITAGLAALTHPNGILMIFSISLAFAIWIRGKSIGKLVLLAGVGLAITVLPYIIYVYLASQNSQVNFFDQMQSGMVYRFSIFWELGRWKRFFMRFRLLPVAPVMLLSWVAAWYRSDRKDKALATITFLFSFVLFLVTVNRDERYLAAIVPFWSALIIRLIWRLATDESFIWCKKIKTPFAAGVIIAGVYMVTCLAGIGTIFYCLRGADFNKIIKRIAAVVEPDSRVYGNPVFWFRHKDYQYAPYLISYKGIPVQDAVEMILEYEPDYIIRTTWWTGPPLGIEPAPTSMPEFKKGWLVDIVCQRLGKKVDEFHDPYYGPIEIYKLER